MVMATAGRGVDGAVASTTWRAVAEPAEGFRDQPGRPAPPRSLAVTTAGRACQHSIGAL